MTLDGASGGTGDGGPGSGGAGSGTAGEPGMISWHHASGWFRLSRFFKSSQFELFKGISSTTALGLNCFGLELLWD